MKSNLKHWYDGVIYDKLIAPNQMKLYQLMINFIPKNSSLIDVACATGSLPFYLSEHCKKIVGVDLSLSNISIANKKLQKNKKSNITFIHGNALKLQEIINEQFDIATITYAIHEMPENIRMTIIKNLLEIAKTVIIADYNAPQSKNFYGKLNYVIEFVAGNNHFSNFKSYIKLGGIPYYLEKLNITNYKSIVFNHNNTKIFVINP